MAGLRLRHRRACEDEERREPGAAVERHGTRVLSKPVGWTADGSEDDVSQGLASLAFA